jgi:prophage DNA circulation protein
MTWRARMKPASFRGVEFSVESAEYSGGRRTVRHEFAQRDEPYSEDIGRRARDFPVEGFVAGDDYIAKRDALIAALETAGPGELIHPYHGIRSVICSGFRIRESAADGGMARFSITFDETPAQPVQPSAVVDSSAAVLTAADSVRSAIGTEFLSKYNPGALTASAADAIRALTLSLDNARSLASLTTAEAAAMRARLDRLTASAAAIVLSPASVLEEVLALLDSVTTTSAALAAYGFSPGRRPPATTATRVQERANYDALTSLARVASIIRAAELALDESFDTYDAAIAMRDAIADRLDEQAELVDDATFGALDALRAALVRAVPGDDSDLPRIVEHSPDVTVPSLVLAHRLYGDVSMESDIVTRNRVLRPGFLVGGQALEVLSDA